MLCGNCKCYSPYEFHAEIGRCRRYNVTVQLRTECLEKKDVKCVGAGKCTLKECMDRVKEDME